MGNARLVIFFYNNNSKLRTSKEKLNSKHTWVFPRFSWQQGLQESVEAAGGATGLDCLTHLSYVALHRSDTTAWKSGFSVCSHFSLLNSYSPWWVRHCLNSSLSILCFHGTAVTLLSKSNTQRPICLHRFSFRLNNYQMWYSSCGQNIFF